MFYDVNVYDLTHHELLTLTSQINYKSRSEFENLLYEAERAGKGDVLSVNDINRLCVDYALPELTHIVCILS